MYFLIEIFNKRGMYGGWYTTRHIVPTFNSNGIVHSYMV